jgi:hypothetical protein
LLKPFWLLRPLQYWGLNSGPQACKASILSRQVDIPLALFFDFLKLEALKR